MAPKNKKPENNDDRAWSLRDIAQETRFLEIYLVETWGEHQRQRERVTEVDRRAEECAKRFHMDNKPPVDSHLIRSQSALDNHGLPVAGKIRAAELTKNLVRQ
jgi:hypothetical protein